MKPLSQLSLHCYPPPRAASDMLPMRPAEYCLVSFASEIRYDLGQVHLVQSHSACINQRILLLLLCTCCCARLAIDTCNCRALLLLSPRNERRDAFIAGLSAVLGFQPATTVSLHQGTFASSASQELKAMQAGVECRRSLAWWVVLELCGAAVVF